jgi:broad specificity phosphatase PhoE
MRHFKVLDLCEEKKFNSEQIDAWVEQYDRSSLEFKSVNLPSVDMVITSELDRSKKTAQMLNLKYKSDRDLNEISTKAFINTKKRFSKNSWLFMGRVLWTLNLLKSSENRIDTSKRAKIMALKLDQNGYDSTLAISHGFFMIFLNKELKKLGYRSIMPKYVKNGVIYKLQKGNS